MRRFFLNWLRWLFKFEERLNIYVLVYDIIDEILSYDLVEMIKVNNLGINLNMRSFIVIIFRNLGVGWKVCGYRLLMVNSFNNSFWICLVINEIYIMKIKVYLFNLIKL